MARSFISLQLLWCPETLEATESAMGSSTTVKDPGSVKSIAELARVQMLQKQLLMRMSDESLMDKHRYLMNSVPCHRTSFLLNLACFEMINFLPTFPPF